jgi:hypothetical protein
MDTTPPQAPPAITNSEHQPAIDTVGRLADVQRWLVEQRDALPAWPAQPSAEGKAGYLDSLTDYWRAPVALAPGAPPVTRATALAAKLASAMHDDATLLGLDGTLDERAVAWVASLARSRDGVPPDLVASELMIGDTPYAGALVLQKHDVDDLALLFTPEAGWQTYPGLDTLHEAAETHIREALVTADELPGIVPADIEPQLDARFVSSRDLGPDAFAVLVARIAHVQEQRVAGAWDDFAAGLLPTDALYDRVHEALDLNDHLDVHAMLSRRDIRLGEAVEQARLAGLPAEVRAASKQARRAYMDALAQASQQRSAAGLVDIRSLHDFAHDVLRQRLSAHGITDAPGDIAVHVTPRATDLPALVSQVFLTPSSRRASLVELAYQNIGRFSAAALSAERMDGSALSAPLGSQAIADIVREADVGTRYAAYLDERLLGSTEARTSRSIARKLHQSRMRFELEESRLSYYRQDVPRAFAHGDRDVGYRWAKAVIDAPDAASRATVDGHTIVARQVMYRGVPLTDVFEVGTRAQSDTSRVVYYTPDAPDGVAFREFYSREDAARHFFLDPAYEGWLLDRLPTAFAETAANGTRRFKVSDAAQRNRWVFAQDNAGHYTRMEENLETRIVEGDLIDAQYDASVALMKNHVATLARSTETADWTATADALASVTATSSPAHGLAADLLAQSLRQATQVMPSLWRMEDNLRAGDHPQAFLDFVEAYHSSLNVIGVRPLRGIRLPGMLVRGGSRSATVAPSRQRVLPPDSFFESRFIAHGVDAAHADALSDGVLRIGTGRYISQHGRLYGVRFDAGHGTWRLTRSGALDANYTGPAIERSAAGTWQHARRIGLRGGGEDRLRKLFGRFPKERADPRVAALSPTQRRALLDELHRLAGNRNQAVTIYGSMRRADSALRGAGLNLAQQGYFHRALQHALALPRGPAATVGRVQPFATPPRPATPRVTTAVTNRPALSGGMVAMRQPEGLAATASGQQLLVELPPASWPDAAWVYLTPGEVAARTGAVDIRLSQGVLAQGRVAGVAGLTLPPGTLLTAVPGVPAHLGGPTATLGSFAGGWVRIDLGAVRARAGVDGLPLFRVSTTGAPGNSGVIINPRPTAADPYAVRDVWLASGEYELGTWSPLPTTSP